MSKEECKDKDTNPRCPCCPYLVTISESSADIKWLKKGYWIQTAFSAGTFFSVLGIALYVVTGHKVI